MVRDGSEELVSHEGTMTVFGSGGNGAGGMDWMNHASGVVKETVADVGTWSRAVHWKPSA